VVVNRRRGRGWAGSGSATACIAEVVKRVSRVERIISHELPRRPVKLIAARFRIQINYAAKDTAIFGLLVMRLDLELVDGINDRQHAIDGSTEVRIDDAVVIIEDGSILLTVQRGLEEVRPRNSGNSGVGGAHARSLRRRHGIRAR